MTKFKNCTCEQRVYVDDLEEGFYWGVKETVLEFRRKNRPKSKPTILQEKSPVLIKISGCGKFLKWKILDHCYSGSIDIDEYHQGSIHRLDYFIKIDRPI